MAGNVFEWCWDIYGIPYGQSTTNNPTGLATGSFRVGRDDSWSLDANYARCANRGYGGYGAGYENSSTGFRCVRGL
jgi:formylglycine-generating enzyme